MKILILLMLLPLVGNAKSFKTDTLEQCHGAPLIPSLSTKTTCMGLVTGKYISAHPAKWSMPRKIVFVDANTALVSAMGSWKRNEGQIWKLNFKNKVLISQELIFERTDRTHGLSVGPDNWIYYGDATRIYRFQLQDPRQTLEVVIDKLPDEYRDQQGAVSPSSHPLTEFIFAENKSLIVNVGAPSNDCSQEFKKFKACYQRDQQAELRKYNYDERTRSYHPQYEVLARGLRNSMGLVYNKIINGIYQAENSSDNPGTPDEINFVSLQNNMTLDFGWPFCVGTETYKGYSNFKTFCSTKAMPPLIYLTPHAAPLDMLYYEGVMFPEYKNSIMISYHGHRPSGSKIAVFKTDEKLQPLADYSHKKEPEMLIPKDWNANRGHPKGRPVGMAVDAYGAIYVLDDQNESLHVIAKSQNVVIRDEGTDKDSEIEVHKMFSSQQLDGWDFIFEGLNKSTCTACHSDVVIFNNSTETLKRMILNSWIDIEDHNIENQPLWVRLVGHDGARMMPPPPDIPISQTHVKYLEAWIQNL